jgi:beta-glucanase (GH16 family)
MSKPMWHRVWDWVVKFINSTPPPKSIPEPIPTPPPTSTLLFRDDFSNLSSWRLYDSAGHAGNGLRSPSQISVVDGILTITGTANGTTGGMMLSGHELTGGTVSVRMRAPAGAGKYHPVVLLWPSTDRWPDDGEIDFVEILNRPERDRNDFTVHYGTANSQISNGIAVDMTQWHTYSVTWTPDYISAAVDDVEYFRTTDKAAFPPVPMNVCIQLDWFPYADTTSGSGVMEVDWVEISA